MERDCESELSKLNIEQNACIYHFGASVIHGQRSNILRLRLFLDVPNFGTIFINKKTTNLSIRSFLFSVFIFHFIELLHSYIDVRLQPIRNALVLDVELYRYLFLFASESIQNASLYHHSYYSINIH